MKIISPSFEFIDIVDSSKMLSNIEKAGRTCYKSEDKITDTSAKEFVRKILLNGHESVVEHEKITIKVVCDRGVSHEIVRHRIASYSQESTRYCNYSDDRFGNELTFIRPCYWPVDSYPYNIWYKQMESIEKSYNELIFLGSKPEEARSILPNSLKTEIVITMNLREWRHFFKLRTSSRAHPQMREIANMVFHDFKQKLPEIFGDIIINE